MLKSTTDVWLAAFLQKSGHQLVKYDIVQRGKVKFYFDLDEDTWRDHKVEFHNSELSEYKNAIAQLKDLAY